MVKIDIDRARCCYCGGCVGVCPQNALELREAILYVDDDKCIGCGICAKFCPVDAITKQDVKQGI
ncbi:MAG: 4Fe-4S binding protein [Candidatus Altiarchaeota archaeon]|nr:4Fe-4S binding protein [Candidatus Altiarchaeota archaeon]